MGVSVSLRKSYTFQHFFGWIPNFISMCSMPSTRLLNYLVSELCLVAVNQLLKHPTAGYLIVNESNPRHCWDCCLPSIRMEGSWFVLVIESQSSKLNVMSSSPTQSNLLWSTLITDQSSTSISSLITISFEYLLALQNNLYYNKSRVSWRPKWLAW